MGPGSGWLESFGSAEEFLESGRLDDTDCLISDVQMPGMNGLELQQLNAQGSHVPIIIVAADPGRLPVAHRRYDQVQAADGGMPACWRSGGRQ
jgi:FixJ family two-component response regulator